MPTLVVKNLPEQLHQKLKLQAERNHRSVTKEVISIIEASVNAPRAKFQMPPPLKLKSGKMLTIDRLKTPSQMGKSSPLLTEA